MCRGFSYFPPFFIDKVLPSPNKVGVFYLYLFLIRFILYLIKQKLKKK